jgi:DNA-directed RNA polymerase specialized sigma subunit
MKIMTLSGGIVMEGFEDITFLDKEAFSQDQDMSRADKEKELALRFQKGDMNAFRELRRAYEPFIMKAAINAQPTSKDVSLAQIKARVYGQFPKMLLEYDPSKAQLNTHLMGRITGHLSNAVKDYLSGPHVPRTKRDELNRYDQARREAVQTHGENPTDEQVFAAYKDNHPDKEWEEFMDAKKYSNTTTIGDAPMGQDSEDGGAPLRIKDQYDVASVLEDEDDAYRTMELDHVLDVMRNNLSETDYNVVKEHKVDGESMARVAMRYNMSSTKLRSILDKWDEVRKQHNL